MPHIDLPAGIPGIVGPMAFRPETAKPLNDLAEVLLRGDNSLSRGDRELIAAYVSHLNATTFCESVHGSMAALQLEGGYELVDAVKVDAGTAAVSDKMRALLAIAAKVTEDGHKVTDDDVAAARQQGATDIEIHDAVLIAAAFCMYNRYVDGLATVLPDDPGAYEGMAQMLMQFGYAGMPPVA
jgi:uncharacterized peroxidase-related enzyme